MPTEQPDQSPHKPPGRMRLLWQALGRNRAGRLLRLAIIAITGWAAVESVKSLSHHIYTSLFMNKPGFAVSYAIDFAMGLRVQTEMDAAALAVEPAYPLPPICLTDPRYTGRASFYDQLSACVEGITTAGAIFGPWCSFDIGWKTICTPRIYGRHILEHPDTLERLISAIKHPCRYLPAPEKIAQASDTPQSWVQNLNEAWTEAGCDGIREISPYWYQLEFIEPSKRYPGKNDRIYMMVSNRDPS